MKRSRKDKLDEIYREHAKSLYYYLYRLSGSSHIAEDLVQETFYKATISLSFYQDYEVEAGCLKLPDMPI
ncbi:sigma factor [Anaerobacillus sp. CMMVII]|uniref:sigma factor n=1 Tax=Anaerobacillus sp. CMMVII TaxID=2755588 RepID=UPI0021B794BB|nr:sigma factor [Anaerobacillus sp. CMMVII]